MPQDSIEQAGDPASETPVNKSTAKPRPGNGNPAPTEPESAPGAEGDTGTPGTATGDPVAEEAGERDPASLEAEITSLRATVDSHWDKVLRMNAEMENLRKRTERDLENAHRYALERFVAELLPVKDSLELGLDAALDGQHDLAAIREGYELTVKMFASALEKFAIEEINPEGEAFDPELHQAMTTQPAEGVAPGTVLNVVQKGYRLNQRLVRPALVIVSK